MKITKETVYNSIERELKMYTLYHLHDCLDWGSDRSSGYYDGCMMVKDGLKICDDIGTSAELLSACVREYCDEIIERMSKENDYEPFNEYDLGRYAIFNHMMVFCNDLCKIQKECNDER